MFALYHSGYIAQSKPAHILPATFGYLASARALASNRRKSEFGPTVSVEVLL